MSPMFYKGAVDRIDSSQLYLKITLEEVARLESQKGS